MRRGHLAASVPCGKGGSHPFKTICDQSKSTKPGCFKSAGGARVICNTLVWRFVALRTRNPFIAPRDTPISATFEITCRKFIIVTTDGRTTQSSGKVSWRLFAWSKTHEGENLIVDLEVQDVELVEIVAEVVSVTPCEGGYSYGTHFSMEQRRMQAPKIRQRLLQIEDKLRSNDQFPTDD